MDLKKVNNKYFFYWGNPSFWIYNIKSFFRGIKNDYLRSKYGVAPIDCGDLDVYIMKSLQNELKIFRKNSLGFPDKLTKEEWNKILDHMIHLLDITLEDESPVAKEAFKLYLSTYSIKTGEKDPFFKDEWLQKTEEWEEYRADCWNEFCDYLKEWGRHLCF